MIAVLPSNYSGQLDFKESIHTVAGGQTVQFAQSNSSRIWLAFMCGANTLTWFPRPNPIGFHGITNGGFFYKQFSWKDDGLLPTLDWYCGNYGLALHTFTVWEQFYVPSLGSK